MSRRSVLIVSAASLAVITAAIVALFGLKWRIDHERYQDADPAFRPLVPLGVTVLSNPAPFHRYCNYIVEFPMDCKLSDANAAALACLNQLPEENRLDLFIRTPRVTDSSVSCLKAVRKLAFLDVTQTSVSDEGIEGLRKALPKAKVVKRREEPADTGQPQGPAAADQPGG